MFKYGKSITKEQAKKRNGFEQKRFSDNLRLIQFEEKAFEKSHTAKVNRHLSWMGKTENNCVYRPPSIPFDEFPYIEEEEESAEDSNEQVKMEQSIKQLLLTNGEIDIEKVLCLHLLAIKQSSACPMRDDFPRHINVFTRYANLLPNYIIESGDSKIKCSCWERKSPKMKCDIRPIKIHLTINKQIEKIINIVIITLKELNEKKLKLLISMAHDINVLHTILVRPGNQHYLTDLLKSKLVLNSEEYETECCTLMKGSNEMIRDVNKYKKNMVFRLNPPNSLVYLQAILSDLDKYSSNTNLKKRDSFCSLLDICKKISIGEDINLVGFSVLRNKSINSTGTAVISEDGNDITYVAVPNCKKAKNIDLFENNLTLLLKSTGFMDKEKEDTKPEEKKEEDKTINHYTRMCNRKIRSLEEIAKKQIDKMKLKKKNKKEVKEPLSPDALRASILKRLSNQQRILLAQESSRMKSKKDSFKSEDMNVAPLAHIMSNVMSKRSLLNLARNSTKEEREYFLKPVKKGGLGLGEIIIGKSNMSKMEKIAAFAQGETSITMITPLGDQTTTIPEKGSSIAISTDSSWDLLKIKHDISQAEISKKFSRFLRSHAKTEDDYGKQDKYGKMFRPPTLAKALLETRNLAKKTQSEIKDQTKTVAKSNLKKTMNTHN